jgi:hypothetical protein
MPNAMRELVDVHYPDATCIRVYTGISGANPFDANGTFRRPHSRQLFPNYRHGR